MFRVYVNGNAVKKVYQSSRSSCAVGTIALFVLFLAASAPHRVHHFFADFQLTQAARKVPAGAPALASPRKHELGTERHAKAPSAEIHRHDDGAIHVQRSTELRRHTQPSQSSGAPDHDSLIPEASHANAPRDDAHHDNSAQTDCVMQSVAQNSHLTPIQAIEIVFPELEVEAHPDLMTARRSHFNPSPFSQRAPPSA